MLGVSKRINSDTKGDSSISVHYGSEIKSENGYDLSLVSAGGYIARNTPIIANNVAEDLATVTSSATIPMINDDGTEPKSLKVLSCQRCRVRKVKCDFGHPCSSCLKIGAECIRITSDMRKKRPPANYVSSLEKKIDTFTKFFENFKKLKSIEEKQDFLDNNNLESMLQQNKVQFTTNSHYNRNNDSHVSKIRPVYGPTSVYDTELAGKVPSTNQKREESSLNILNKDPDVIHCLKLFFTWQYPDHNMFIFRESFLTDFFHPKPNSSYCSRILVLSICALGSRMSESDSTYNKSTQYYNEARSALLSRLDHPSIPSLQSFLLLAFYDICNGSNSSGWMLSGNAMRMGFDLGFQLNPEVWFLKPQIESSPLDVSIRSRIYWGSYLADHFISLVLGRPSLLKVSDASIPETDNLPDLEWIDDYRYIDSEDLKNKEKVRNSNISDPLKSVINLINISDNFLNDIFTKSEEDNFDEHHNLEDLNLISRLEKLFEYNAQITKWKENLPEDLNWTRDKLRTTGDNPSSACVRYYYYILILCLNRPFVGITKDFKDKQHLSPAVICYKAIEDLYVAIKRFKEIHGLRRVSIFIVYCCILSISVILLTNTTEQLEGENKKHLEFFMDALNGSSRTWKLAEKSYKLIKIKLQYKSKTDSSQTTKTGKRKQVTQIAAKPKKILPNNKDRALQLPQEVDIKIPEKLSPMPSYQATPSAPSADSNNLVSQQNEELLSKQLPEVVTSPVSQSNSVTSNISNSYIDNIADPDGNNSRRVVDANTEILFDKNLDFFGGPPVLMTSDLFNEDWESLFPDYIFNSKNSNEPSQ